MPRRLRLLAVALVLLAPLVASQQSAYATTWRLNPKDNIAPPSYAVNGVCVSAPMSIACTTLWVRALNYARGRMGQPHYVLPYRFNWLTPSDQLLVLANQDRVLYGRVPLSGRNVQLNASARRAVIAADDPTVVPIQGTAPYSGGGNWFGGSGQWSALYAYYDWMYNDGVGSGNLACTHPGEWGCWGHRDITLARFGPTHKVLLGVGGGSDAHGGSGWTELFEAFEQTDVTPMIPTVQGISAHTGQAGTTVHIAGFGLPHTDRVAVVGRTAKVLRRGPYAVDITVPAGSGTGWVVVATNGGVSGKNYASAFSYS